MLWFWPTKRRHRNRKPKKKVEHEGQEEHNVYYNQKIADHFVTL
jgi:hypothetical protein